MPFTLKDAFRVKGTGTSYGLPGLTMVPAFGNCLLVELLFNARAVLLGQTNVPSSCFDWQTRSSRGHGEQIAGFCSHGERHTLRSHEPIIRSRSDPLPAVPRHPAATMKMPAAVAHLMGTSWTSDAPLEGWRHFHVVQISRGDEAWVVELAASCDANRRVHATSRALLKREGWHPGWARLR